MPRARSDAKRTALLEAATRIIVTQGLSAPTAGIAKEAGIPNGSLFTYFETKTELFNQLYLELKGEMAATALKGLPARAEPRERMFHTWRNWTNWAVTFPEKRQVLAQLSVSGEITVESRTAVTRQSNRGKCTVKLRYCTQITEFSMRLYSIHGQSGLELTRRKIFPF